MRTLAQLWRLLFAPTPKPHQRAVRHAALVKAARAEQRRATADNDAWAVQQFLDRYRNTGAV